MADKMVAGIRRRTNRCFDDKKYLRVESINKMHLPKEIVRDLKIV